MKFSPFTISVLKNFSTINSGVVLQPGKKQRTIDQSKTIFAEVLLEDDLPQGFGIYDLNQFLGNVTTLDNPNLTFTDTAVIMDDGKMSLTYYGCATNIIISPDSDKDIKMDSPDVTFSLTSVTLQ